MIPIILASNSPRRKEILENLGLTFQVVPFTGKEKSKGRSADQVVREIAMAKAIGVARQLTEEGQDLSNTLIIAADTAVVHEMDILGKPKTKKDALAMLERLQGNTHFVTTGLALIYGDKVCCQNDLTKVTFCPVPREELEAYVKTGEPKDKAGSYAIQGRASLWIKGIVGDYFNVVGFPVHLFYNLLKELGLSLEQLQK